MELVASMETLDYGPFPKLEALSEKTLERVLVIEDDVSLVNLLTHVLEEMHPGVLIDWATSGEEAEYYIKRESEIYPELPYDLIVADIFLEGETTGLDIWKLCDDEFPQTQILVTSSLPVEKFLSSLQNEMNLPAYLPKPFTMRECLEAIEEFS